MAERAEDLRTDTGLSHDGVTPARASFRLPRQETLDCHIALLFTKDGDAFSPRGGISLFELVRQVSAAPDFTGVWPSVHSISDELVQSIGLESQKSRFPLPNLSASQVGEIRKFLLNSGIPFRNPEPNPPSRFHVDDAGLSERVGNARPILVEDALLHLGCSEQLIADDLTLPEDVERPKIYKLRNVTLAGDYVAVSLVGSHCLTDSDHLCHHHGDILAPRLQESLSGSYHVTLKHGDYVSLVGSASENFWHFMAETLPKLVAAQKAGFEGKYIIPSSAKYPYAREALKLMDIPDSRIEEFDGGVWEVQTLWVPSHIPLWESPFAGTDLQRSAHPWLLKEVRQALISGVLEQAELSDHPTPERIWVVREEAVRRHPMQNTAEVRDILIGEYGFEPVDMAQLSLADQIRYSMNSKCLVGQHGAGMFHMLFLPPDASAIEFYSTGYMVDFDVPVRNANDIRYESMVWAPAFIEESPNGTGDELRIDPSKVDVNVNIRALRSNLRRLLNRKSLP